MSIWPSCGGGGRNPRSPPCAHLWLPPYITEVPTRNCIGVWNILTGKLLSKLANSTHGAICTHAVITTTGKLIVSAESGLVLYWNVKDESVIFQEEQENVLQMFLFEDEIRST